MDIAVLGATGTMGALVSERLLEQGHHVRPLARNAGVDALDVGSLREAMAGADAVVDAFNHLTLDGGRAVRLFSAVATNVARAAESTGVRRILDVGIFGASDPAVHRIYGRYRGKAAQEEIYRRAATPSTIVLSAQWFSLIPMVVRQATLGPVAVLPAMRMAPVAAESVADLIAADLEHDDGERRTHSIRGPEQMSSAEAARRWMSVRGDVDGLRPRIVLDLPYFGRAIAGGGLVPRTGVVDPITLEQWLRDATS